MSRRAVRIRSVLRGRAMQTTAYLEQRDEAPVIKSLRNLGHSRFEIEVVPGCQVWGCDGCENCGSWACGTPVRG